MRRYQAERRQRKKAQGVAALLWMAAAVLLFLAWAGKAAAGEVPPAGETPGGGELEEGGEELPGERTWEIVWVKENGEIREDREETRYTSQREFQVEFLLAAEEDISVVVCDSTELTVQQALRQSVCDASQARRERIAVVGGAQSENVEALVQRAEGLNSERVVLAAPGDDTGLAAAAVAGAIAGESDPAIPLGGAELKGLEGMEARYADTEIDTLVRGGVTPLENVSGVVSVVRGVTTRTKTGEAEDATWRELTTIRIVDDVIPTIRNSLRAKFRRTKNTEQTRGAIRSQVVLELENKLAREIITGYDQVTVEADTENPTVCLVDFTFTVAHGLNQIWLTAHITV